MFNKRYLYFLFIFNYHFVPIWGWIIINLIIYGNTQ